MGSMIVKIALSGVTVGVLLHYLKSIDSQLTPYVLLGFSATVLILVIPQINEFYKIVIGLSDMAKEAGVGTVYLGTIMKITGIAYICTMCADVCDEVGATSVARKIEMAGKIGIAMIGMGILKTLGETLLGIIKSV